MNDEAGCFYYQVYLLCVWRETNDSPCRFLLEMVPSGRRRGFTTLEGLFDWLADSAAGASGVSPIRGPFGAEPAREFLRSVKRKEGDL